MNLVFLGPPGAGKGTQARLLQEREAIPQVSTGDMLRTAMAAGTTLGEEARAYVERGALVPDDIMIGLIEERLAQPDARRGFVLDGFPRTLPQAEALDHVLDAAGRVLEAVLYFQVSDDAIIQRLTGRWVCRQRGHIYHLEFNPPKAAGRCDVDGSELYQRADDRPETVLHRLDVYHRETDPVVEFYRTRGLFDTIDAEGDIEAVYQIVLRTIRGRMAVRAQAPGA